MSKPPYVAHARRVGILLGSGLAFAAVPAVASASAVNLGTARPLRSPRGLGRRQYRTLGAQR